MKVLHPPAPIAIQVELTHDELCGLMKMIGSTSVRSRVRENKLTEDQSQALSNIYDALAIYLPEKDR